MGDDRPYEIVAEGKRTGLVESFQWNGFFYDFTYYSYDRASSAYHRMGDDEVYQMGKAEFDEAYEEGTLFLLTMHPFVSGHRSRIAQLDRLVAYMKSKSGVWFATHQDVARVAAKQLEK